MEILEKYNITQEQLEEIRTWAGYENRLRRFKNNSTLDTFKEIFKNDAERLREHYFDLKFDIQQFLTYLTQDQKNDFFAYITKNYSKS